MSVSAISEQKSIERETPNSRPIKWEQFDLLVGKSQSTILNGTVDNQLLKGTHLSCPICTEAGKWENRKLFIESVLTDVILHCPKDEPLVLISFGADRLLVEYILGKSLIESGFQKILFLLVDPVYKFSDPENLKYIDHAREDFSKKIESVYLKKNKEKFPQEHIRYLSRSQNIAKYFPSYANVAVIESLPPYAETVKEMQKFKLKEKAPKDLMVGGYLVESNQANAVAFMPKQYAEQLSNSGAKFTCCLPAGIFKDNRSSFFIDWGCKIRSDGTYFLSFTGEEHFLSPLNITPEMQIKIPTGEVIQAKQWIPKIRQAIEQELSKQIDAIKNGKSQQKLTQENVTTLLEKVKEIFVFYMPGARHFFSADYVTDRDEAMAFIAANAGHHYRKAISLMADHTSGYKISVDEIR